MLLEQNSPALYFAVELLVLTLAFAAEVLASILDFTLAFAAELLASTLDFAAEVLLAEWVELAAACEAVDELLEPQAAAPSVRARDAPSTGINARNFTDVLLTLFWVDEP